MIDGPRSHVIEQAHNRMHAARGAAGVPDGRALMATQGATPADHRQAHRRARVTNQPQLVDLLADEGIAATQATVSRDLEDLGAVKVRVPGGETVYAIPEYEPARIAPEDQLRRVMGEWVAEVQPLRQPRRAAHTARLRPRRRLGARPLGHDGLIGTVAGDDTLLCVAEETLGGHGAGRTRPRGTGRDRISERATTRRRKTRCGTGGSRAARRRS